MSGRGLVLAALAVTALAAFSAASAEPPANVPPAPLTNEDIVRMVVGGASEAAIVEAIQTHPEAFDLSDDILPELKLAGVSEPILTAMRRRHAASTPAPAPVEAPARGRRHVVVTLNAGAALSRTLRVPDWADEDMKQRFQLPKEIDQRKVKDVAVFLACTTIEHVPDLWRTKTPLGRDLVGATRHEMLAFVAGDTPEGKKPELNLPRTLEADIDESEPHDLAVGVAARIGDRWVQLAIGILPKFKPGPQPAELAARIAHAGGSFGFKVEWTPPR